MIAKGLFGRLRFESYNGHSYVTPREAFAADESDEALYVWPDPSTWGLAPALLGKRVALIGNVPIHGRGAEIDAFDEVIRINRMEYWQRSAVDDGARITIWAGLPRRRVIFPQGSSGEQSRQSFLQESADRRHQSDAAFLPSVAFVSRFPEIASSVSTIWSATPFHLSVAFYKYLAGKGLLDRLFVSGSGPFLHDYLAQKVSSGMMHALFTIPLIRSSSGPFAQQPNFELLLTGVRLVLFCTLAGASQVGLFGFNFYDKTEKRPPPTHDLDFEKEFLTALTDAAPSWGSEITNT